MVEYFTLLETISKLKKDESLEARTLHSILLVETGLPLQFAMERATAYLEGKDAASTRRD